MRQDRCPEEFSIWLESGRSKSVMLLWMNNARTVNVGHKELGRWSLLACVREGFFTELEVETDRWHINKIPAFRGGSCR